MFEEEKVTKEKFKYIGFKYFCPEDGILKENFNIPKDLIYLNIWNNAVLIIKDCSCKKEHHQVINECQVIFSDWQKI